MKEKIIKFLDEADFWSAMVDAYLIVRKAVTWVLLIFWIVTMAIEAIVIVGGFFFSSMWWVLALVPWLVLVWLTIAVYRAFLEDILF